jgi:plastocyanin domain-containing protein
MTPEIVWTPDRIAAAVGGVAALSFLWVFFFGRKRPAVAARETETGAQEIRVVVSGGYTPGRILARRGRPLRLLFDRREENPCSDEVVLPEWGIRRALPAFAVTPVEVVPERTGEFPFSCGMNMLHGAIEVVE